LKKNIHIGCGSTVGKNWENYDASYRLLLEKFLPIKKKIFPEKVIYGNIIKKKFCKDNEANNIFCSHALEHMSNYEMRLSLINIYQMLKPGGCFRVVIPSLNSRIKKYLKNQDANWFIDSLNFVTKNRETFYDKIIKIFSKSQHKYMYDERSFLNELKTSGFVNIKKCKYGDSQIKYFSEIERKQRFIEDGNMKAIAYECSKKFTK